MIVLAAAALALILFPAIAVAQEPVKTFDQLSTRLKVRDTIWVTDADGREIKGRILELGAASLVLDAEGKTSFAAPDIRQIRVRKHDLMWDGTLIGLAVGMAAGLALGATDSQDEGLMEAQYFLMLGAAVGTGTGFAIDAARKGKTLVVYAARGTQSSAHLSLAPIVTTRHGGVRVAFSF